MNMSNKCNKQLDIVYEYKISKFEDLKRFLEEKEIKKFLDVKKWNNYYFFDEKKLNLDYLKIKNKILDKIKNDENILIKSDYDTDWFLSWLIMFLWLNLLKESYQSNSEIKIKFTNRLEWYWWQFLIDYLTEKDNIWFDFSLLISTDEWITNVLNEKLLKKIDIIIFDHHMPLNHILYNFEEFKWYIFKKFKKEINSEFKEFDLNNFFIEKYHNNCEVDTKNITLTKDEKKLIKNFLNTKKWKELYKKLNEEHKLLIDDYMVLTKKDYFYWINEEKNKKIELFTWNSDDIKTSAWWTVFNFFRELIKDFQNEWKINLVKNLRWLINLFSVFWWITIVSDKMPLQVLENYSIVQLSFKILNIILKEFLKNNINVENHKINDEFKIFLIKRLFWLEWSQNNELLLLIYNTIYFIFKTVWFNEIKYKSIWFWIAPVINSFWRLFSINILFEKLLKWELDDILFWNNKRKKITTQLIKELEKWEIFNKYEWKTVTIFEFNWLENFWKEYEKLIKFYSTYLSNSSRYLFDIDYLEDPWFCLSPKEMQKLLDFKLNLNKIFDNSYINIDWMLSLISSKLMWQYWKNVIVWKTLNNWIFKWSARFNVNFFDYNLHKLNSINKAWWHNKAFWIEIQNITEFINEIDNSLEKIWQDKINKSNTILIKLNVILEDWFYDFFTKYLDIIKELFELEIQLNDLEKFIEEEKIKIWTFKNDKVKLVKLNLLNKMTELLYFNDDLFNLLDEKWEIWLIKELNWKIQQVNDFNINNYNNFLNFILSY